MRKVVIFGTLAAALVLLAGSCTRENLVSGQSGDEATISFAIGLENVAQTRAISDGSGADALYYAVYDEDGALVSTDYIVEYASGVEFPKTESVTLAKGKTYQIAFWAQNSNCTAYTLDYGSTSSTDGMTMTVDYTAITNNDETSDAFFAAVSVNVTANTSLSVELKRPFAQVNVGVTQADWDTAVEDGIEIKTSAVTFGPVANVLNLLDGTVTVADDDAELVVNAIPYDSTAAEPEYLSVDIDGDGSSEEYVWLSMSYILAPDTTTGSASALTKADYTFYSDAAGSVEVLELVEGLDNLPVQRNWRTNIVGTILSSVVEFTIVIDPEFDGDTSEDVAEGVVYYPTMKTYAISTVGGLEWLSDHVNGTNDFGTNDEGAAANTFYGYTVVLADDIDLDGIEWIPIGTSSDRFNGAFDGNGHTISNLTVNGSTEDSSGNYSGLFGYTGYPTNSSGSEIIKNLTIKNAKVTGYKYVGTVVARPYHTLLSNITVEGLVQVEGFCYVGGVAGGSLYTTKGHVSMENITVDADDESYVIGHRIDSSDGLEHTYAGGIIGHTNQDASATYQNLTSNIDVTGDNGGVGGIFGIANGVSYTNCSCSGNIKVTNAQDAYASNEYYTQNGKNGAGNYADQIGGIAGTWGNINGRTTTFTGCTFTGTLDLTAVEGYTGPEIDLSDNTIIGSKHYVLAGGTLIIDGETIYTDDDRETETVVVTPYNDIEATSYTDTWNASSSDGATAKLVTDDDDSYVEVTLGVASNSKGVGNLNFASTDDVVTLDPDYPILCFRVTNLNDDANYSAAITIDTNGGKLQSDNTEYKGSIGNGSNKWSNKWTCEDGSELLIYNLSEQAIGSIGTLTGICDFTTFQLKYADVLSGSNSTYSTDEGLSYKFYWFKSFASEDDLETYLGQIDLTYTK